MKCTTVITSFNRCHCIKRAIDSALRELPGQEILIIDDASTDGTPSYIQRFYKREIKKGEISLYCLPSNIGVSGAKNLGYEYAQGNWVVFLDSDDYYEVDAGQWMKKEMEFAMSYPIVFFRCRTHLGDFVGSHKGKRLLINLDTYLHYTSFGEALTVVNKAMIGTKPPYIQELRGYEGLGCARLIHRYGPAFLSNVIARVYVTKGADRLSAKDAFFRRMPLMARGHFRMIREFWIYMSKQYAVTLICKGLLYFVLGNCYKLLKKK